ncbi:hypothetical protein [Desulfovibrio inopinatus]|uniref:hypothetical protein n=1 Tax=Desulfovibrio inopinatus TaxID=102109 RepID=UPI000426F137|nr:hypothetical protein [Desulfovibrio inopinatus]
MLAIKLHKDAKPWLGKNTCLIPVFSWEWAEEAVAHWAEGIQGIHPSQKGKVNYVTLVEVGPDHPVSVITAWQDPRKAEQEFQPMSQWEDELRTTMKETMEHKLRIAPPMVNVGTLVQSDQYRCHMHVNLPKILLAKRLPKAKIVWTKALSDVVRKDLFGGETQETAKT